MEVLIRIAILTLLSLKTKEVFPFKLITKEESKEQGEQQTGESSQIESQTEVNVESEETMQIPMTESGSSLLQLFEDFEEREEEELQFDISEFLVLPEQIEVEQRQSNEPKEKQESQKRGSVSEEIMEESTFEEEAQGSRETQSSLPISSEGLSLLEQLELFEEGEISTASISGTGGGLIEEALSAAGITMITECEHQERAVETSSISTDESVHSPKRKRKCKRKHGKEDEGQSKSKKKKKKTSPPKKLYKYDTPELKMLRTTKARLSKEKKEISANISYLSRQCTMIGDQISLLSENQKGKSTHQKLLQEKGELVHSVKILEERVNRIDELILESEVEIKEIYKRMREEEEEETFRIKIEEREEHDSEEEAPETETGEIIDLDSEEEEEGYTTGIKWESESETIISYEELSKRNYRFPALSQIRRDICTISIYNSKIKLLCAKSRLRSAPTFERSEEELEEILEIEREIVRQRKILYGRYWRSVIKCKTNWKKLFEGDCLGSDATDKELEELESVIEPLKLTKSIKELYKSVSTETGNKIRAHIKKKEQEKK